MADPNPIAGTDTFPAVVRAPGKGEKASPETFGRGLSDVADRTKYLDARRMESPSALGPPTALGQSLVAIPNPVVTPGMPYVWVQRRGWITPDVDPTGAVDAKSTIEAAANAAAATGRGPVVDCPDGIVRLSSSLTLPHGCTLIGSRRGMRAGDRVFPQPIPVGTRFDIRHTGRAFILTNQECAVFDIGVYYPTQQTISTPDAYDYTFDVTGIGCEVSNVTVVNPDKLMRVAANGFRSDNVYSSPLRRGLTLGRCPDVVRISNWHFNPIANYENAAFMSGFIQANRKCFVIDGAEAYQFTDCFSYGGNHGIVFWDEDGDGFRGSSGSWKGGSLDLHNDCVRIEATHGLSATGHSMSGMSMVTTADGRCVLVGDNLAPGSDVDRPGIHLTDCHGNSAGHGMARYIWVASTSVAHVRANGGDVLNVFNEVARNESANASIVLRDVGSSWGVTRTSGSGPIRDLDGRLLGAVSATGTHRVGAVYKTGQTAAIAATQLFPGTGGVPGSAYEIEVELLCTTASGSGSPTAQVTIAYTDAIGATSVSTATLSLAATGRLRERLPISCVAGTGITYAVAIASPSGTPQYSVRVAARQV